MLRLFSRLAVFLSLLVFLPILLMRAQPLNDSATAELLTPPLGCAAPCFMGIVPGDTTFQQALAILENHAWVQNLRDGGSISWTWSGQQPQLIPTTGRAFIRSFPTSSRVMVAALSIPTRLRYGDLLLAYGNPNRSYLVVQHLSSGTYLTHVAVYTDQRFHVRSPDLRCPLLPGALYRAEMRLEMGIIRETARPQQVISFDHQHDNLTNRVRHLGGC